MSVSVGKCFAVLAAVASALGMAGQSQAEWSFSWLGHLEGDYGSCACAVSADGSVVVGESIEGEYHDDYQPEAFRWTPSGGMVGLDFLPGDAWSQAYDISADGSVIVGYSQTSVGEEGWGEAVRWTASEGIRGLGYLPGYEERSWAYGVSADGLVVVGLSGGWTGRAFRWTEIGGMEDLGYPAELPGGAYSVAHATSVDGSTVVGHWGGAAPVGNQQPFQWTEAGGMVDLGFRGVAHGVSADGTVVVGERYFESNSEAFLWTAEGGPLGLGHLPGDPYSVAHGVSPDGSMVVGSSYFRAFLWDAVGGMRDLNELLVASGLDLQGGTLRSAQGISSDGQTIVIGGEGHGPDGSYQAWMAVIPEPSSLAALVSMAAAGLLGYVWRWRRRAA